MAAMAANASPSECLRQPDRHSSKLGVEDTERATKAIKGVEGKRLTYQQSAH